MKKSQVEKYIKTIIHMQTIMQRCADIYLVFTLLDTEFICAVDVNMLLSVQQ